MICTVCNSQNEETAETCFTCGQPLAAVVTRGTLIAQRYEILSPLGRGGMGMVYKAHDRVLDETVALKVLRGDIAQDPDMARRFRTEIRLARRVRHRNVCGIHEYGEDGRIHFIAMEFIEGIDLKKILKQSRVGLRSDEAFEVAIQVAEGLQAIHDAGIIHRDLKTPNIMRDSKGHVRLMDFGIAKEEGAASGHTATGLIVGTPEYMSPEQARGERVDSRTDIYALGIVIFEVFTGEVPFRGETPLATIMKHLKDPPPVEVMDAHHLPPEVRGVLLKALAKERKDRFPAASLVAEALRQARVHAQPETASGPPPALRESAWSSADGSAQTTAMPTPTPRPPRVPPPPAPRADRRVPVAARSPRTPTTRSSGVTAAARYKARRTPAWLFALPVVALAVVVGGALAMWSTGSSQPEQAPPTSPASAAGSMTLGTPAPAAEVSTTPSVTPSVPARNAPPLPSATAPASARPAPTPLPPRTPLPTPAPASVPTTLATLPFARATPTPAPAPVRGDLWIVVSPWANVSVDGQDLGTSPVRTPLDPGKHDVVLTHPEYQPVRRKVTVTPGKVFRLDVELAQDAVPK